MTRKAFLIVALLALVGGFAFAQDLKIEYQLIVSGAPGSYFTFTGPIRYMAVDKDYVDSATGASKQDSTELFQAYRYDVKGKNTFPDGLRGLFLFAVAPAQMRTDDNLTINKASDGTITVRYVHRGTAYELVTDRNGRFALPNGSYRRRGIGYIQGAGPQVLHRDFSSNGTAASVDWAKVWDSRIAGGKTIASGVSTQTGNIVNDVAASDSMYYWDGALQVTFDQNVLKVSGGLNAVKR